MIYHSRRTQWKEKNTQNDTANTQTAKIEFIDYKDIDMLKHSLSERYKIMPRRLTGNTKKWQERVEVAIKRARHMALIPYVIDHKKVVENPFKL